MTKQLISDIKGDLENYSKWAEANKHKHFSLFDYIHGLSTQGYVKPDFVVALLSFVWPEFRQIDETFILDEEFSQEKYDRGYYMSEIQISETFPDLDFKIQKLIGEIIAEMWKAKLKLDFPNIDFVVECYEDEPEDLCCCFYPAKKT